MIINKNVRIIASQVKVLLFLSHQIDQRIVLTTDNITPKWFFSQLDSAVHTWCFIINLSMKIFVRKSLHNWPLLQFGNFLAMKNCYT